MKLEYDGFFHCSGCGEINIHPVEKHIHVIDGSDFSITFWCEHCHVLSELTFSAREGTASMDFEKAKSGADLDRRNKL